MGILERIAEIENEVCYGEFFDKKSQKLFLYIIGFACSYLPFGWSFTVLLRRWLKLKEIKPQQTIWVY